jgi:uncharacterized protein YcbK (DUF882 family)
VGDLSPHFSSSEFADHVTGQVVVDPNLITHLERLRLEVGKPCVIVSGYRSPTTNRAVGGAVNSQHLYGRAADLRTGYATRDQAVAAGFTGIGVCGGWAVHVDVRPGPLEVFADC